MTQTLHLRLDMLYKRYSIAFWVLCHLLFINKHVFFMKIGHFQWKSILQKFYLANHSVSYLQIWYELGPYHLREGSIRYLVKGRTLFVCTCFLLFSRWFLHETAWNYHQNDRPLPRTADSQHPCYDVVRRFKPLIIKIGAYGASQHVISFWWPATHLKNIQNTTKTVTIRDQSTSKWSVSPYLLPRHAICPNSLVYQKQHVQMSTWPKFENDQFLTLRKKNIFFPKESRYTFLKREGEG